MSRQELVKLTERISRLDHWRRISKLKSLKEAMIYCRVKNVSTQQYGHLIERFIRERYAFAPNTSAKCIGDVCKNGQNFEIKVSLGGYFGDQFNFVQLRPSHKCDWYLLCAYYLARENLHSRGEVFVFKVPRNDLKKLIAKHGTYAHGTKREHGEITHRSLIGNLEYAIRPKFGDRCWASLASFRIEESALV